MFVFFGTASFAQQTEVSDNDLQLDTLVNVNFSLDSNSHLKAIGNSTADSLTKVKKHVENNLNSIDTINKIEHAAEANIKERISGIDTIARSKIILSERNKIDSLNAQLVHRLTENKVGVIHQSSTVVIPTTTTGILGLESNSLQLHKTENRIPNVDLNNVDLNPVNAVPDESNLRNDVKDLQGKSQSYSANIDSIKSIKPEKVDAMAEQKVMQLDEVKNLQEGVDQIEMQKQLIEQYKEQVKLEAELKEKAKEVASDVIVQYQTKVQEQMPNLSKYKRKFNFVQDMRNLPKRAPNSAKDLKWRERVIPGLTFHSMNSTELWLQFDPQVVYRLTGNLSVGLGGMYRFSMNNKRFTFSDFGNLYGVKIVSSYKVYNGFFIQAEGHRVTYQPWKTRLNDPNYKTTVYAIVGGVGKSHAITSRLKGNIQALYHYAFEEDPYRPKVMLKFGMEFSLVKRKKPQWELTLKSLRKCK